MALFSKDNKDFVVIECPAKDCGLKAFGTCVHCSWISEEKAKFPDIEKLKVGVVDNGVG